MYGFTLADQLFDKDPRLPDRYRPGWSFWPPRQRNPGSYDNMNREVRETMAASQDSFDGFKLDLMKNISETWSTQHSVSLSNDQNIQKYVFSISGILSPAVQMFGRVDSDWAVSGKWQQQLSNKLQLRLSGQASHEAHGSSGAVEVAYRGSDWFGDFVWSNPGVYRAAYNQAITNKLSLGGEIAYNHKQAASFGTMTGRYMTPNWIGTATIAFPTVQLSYCRKVGDAMRVAVEYLFSAANGIESKCDLGWVAYFPTAQVAGSVDSQMHCHSQIAGSFGDRDDGINWALTGDIDFKKKKYGVGLNLSISIQ